MGTTTSQAPLSSIFPQLSGGGFPPRFTRAWPRSHRQSFLSAWNGSGDILCGQQMFRNKCGVTCRKLTCMNLTWEHFQRTMTWNGLRRKDRTGKKKRRKRNDMNFHAQSHVPHLFGPYQRLESRPGRQIDLHVANVANLFHLLRSVLSGTAFIMDMCFCVAHFVFILGIQQLR